MKIPVAQRAITSAHYTGRVLRIYRLGQPWVVLEGVSDHYVAIDFAAEVAAVPAVDAEAA